MPGINSKISNHIESLREAQKASWIEMYKKENVAILSTVLPKDVEESFVKEARTLIADNSERRELIIEESGNTPRAYDSVGRDAIRDKGTYIPAVFDSNEFINLLSEIAGETLHPVPYAPEEFIINSQNKANDTHGWHWDDYAFALIWCIDEPDPLAGGRVEFVPNIIWDKENPKERLINTLRAQQVRSIHLKEGECYLMKANTCLHRITPLTEDTKRTVVVMTYASTQDLTDDSITHGSMEDIYPSDTRIEAEARA